MFGHWAQILVVLVIGLLIFGPKRVIEMGSSFGKAFREFREATRGLSWSSLAGDGDEPHGNAALSARDTNVATLSQFTAATNDSIETGQTVEADEIDQMGAIDEADEIDQTGAIDDTSDTDDIGEHGETVAAQQVVDAKVAQVEDTANL